MKICCSKCKVEMRPRMNGVNVLEYNKLEPYRIHQADEWFCVECDATVIIGFSSKSFEPWEKEFTEEFRGIMRTENLKKLREIHELPQRMINKLKEAKEDGTVSEKG